MSDQALNEYRDAREDQLVRNEARHIRSKVNDARGSRHDAGVRWPFELLQNALDAGPRPGLDRIEVHLRRSGNQFIFEHDGAFFALSDLAALLSGGSSKEFESEKTTGRFGTGFLVTHVLAPRTNVSGIFATETSIERFTLTLDRGGDEDSIVANIAACDAAIRSASPLAATDGVPSAAFTYVADDPETLDLGMASFRAAVPYLFATCERLGRVTLAAENGTAEIWDAGVLTCRIVNDASVEVREVSCRTRDSHLSYRAVRVTLPTAPKLAAIAVVANAGDGSHLLVPNDDFPRVFCRYPVRSSAFLPINAIVDAPFELDQERRRVLLDKDEVRETFRAALNAIVPLVRLAYQENWIGRHWLARVAPSPSSFGDKVDEDERAWLTGEMRSLAERLARLPLVDTKHGMGAAVEGAEHGWFADFVDAQTDATTMGRLWPLVNDADSLYPPIATLTDDWAAIARGWHELGIDVNQIGFTLLVTYVRDNAKHLDELRVRGDKRDWLARFLDVVGESWSQRGVTADLLDRMLPNQTGALVPRKNLERDDSIPETLKDIAEVLGCGVRARLVDTAILAFAHERSLSFVESALKSAVPAAMSEESVLDACVRQLEKTFPKADRLSDSNRPLVMASIRLLEYLAQKGGATSPLAIRVPLLARDGTFARTSPQRKMMSPVETWHSSARNFCGAYPQDRVLAPEYGNTAAAGALVEWGVAFPDPLIKTTPSDPIKDNRLRSLAVDTENTDGMHLQGEELTQIALMHELLPRCQEREHAASLLGLALCYVATIDDSWRQTRVVRGRRAGSDVPVAIQGALWLADLRSRAWVPALSDEGRISQLVPTPESLRSLLDPTWLHGNAAALELLGRFFGFDALDLQLLAASDDSSRQQLRDHLARIVELAQSDPETLVHVEAELQEKKKRARDVARSRQLGFSVQAAIKLALEAHQLAVKVVDIGYDFDVSCNDLGDAGNKIEVGSYFIEVKATTQGDAKLTPRQAETASQRADRYVLCVVDLRNTAEERLDQPWLVEDLLPLTRLVPSVGALVQGTWHLVAQARCGEVELRNEGALRYAVPPTVWEKGLSIADWVAEAFVQRGA